MTITMYANAVDPSDAVALIREGPPATPAFQIQLRLRGFGLFRAEVDGAITCLPPITRTVLARLVLVRGGVVDIDDLYRDCWPDPIMTIRREQRVAVHKRIAELRRCLTPQALLTERSASTGYRLLLDADQVDIHTFGDLVFRAAAAHDAVAVELLIQALLMWTERPLLGLPDKAFVRDHVSRLTRLRDRACRELAAGCQTLGRTRDALTIFDHLQAIHPADADLRNLIEQLRTDPRSVTAMTHQEVK